MNEFVKHTSRVKTVILKTFDFDERYRITIEKILEGKFKNQYLIRSYTKSIFGYKLSHLSAWNIELNESDSRIISYEFMPYRMLHQACNYAKHVKKNIYPKWLKYQ